MDLINIRRRILLKEPLVKTASGNPIQISTNLPSKLIDYKFIITPYQEGSGSPSPDNIRNFLRPESCTITLNNENYLINYPQIPSTTRHDFVGVNFDSTKYSNFHADYWYYKWPSNMSSSVVTSISTLGSFTRFWLYFSGVKRISNTVPICNILPSAQQTGMSEYSQQTIKIGCHDSYLNSVWCILPTSLVGTTAASIAEYVKGKMEIVYARESGGDYRISAPDIFLKQGENNLSINLNGNLEINYWDNE